jgi:pilus assembly protein CpaC
MLEVRVAEMSRSLLKRLGVNFNYTRGGEFGVSTLGGLSQIVESGDSNLATEGPLDLFVSSSVNALFRFHKDSANWTGLIDALKENGLIKILAEPTLIALSGQTANFLAGGEYPVPVPQEGDTVTIEYKTYGVGLSFAPIVLGKDRINITVAPEVSELDYSMAVKLAGYVVPALTTRRASTVVELADGQSFAIAGLLKETVRDNIARYPFLGKIPILGVLFRSRSFQKNETELVIIATPHLVKPLDMAKQTLPTDFYIEPDDMEFHLMGLMEGREKNRPQAVEGELDGDFGHAIPSFE